MSAKRRTYIEVEGHLNELRKAGDREEEKHVLLLLVYASIYVYKQCVQGLNNFQHTLVSVYISLENTTITDVRCTDECMVDQVNEKSRRIILSWICGSQDASGGILAGLEKMFTEEHILPRPDNSNICNSNVPLI